MLREMIRIMAAHETGIGFSPVSALNIPTLKAAAFASSMPSSELLTLPQQSGSSDDRARLLQVKRSS